MIVSFFKIIKTLYKILIINNNKHLETLIKMIKNILNKNNNMINTNRRINYKINLNKCTYFNF